MQAIHARGPQRQIRGVILNGDACPACRSPWPVLTDDKKIGEVTSTIWSPGFEANVSLAIIDKAYLHEGQQMMVHGEDGEIRQGRVTGLPMT